MVWGRVLHGEQCDGSLLFRNLLFLLARAYKFIITCQLLVLRCEELCKHHKVDKCVFVWKAG